jgi:3-oxoadipate enol-lactonase
MAGALLYWEDFPVGETVEMGSHTFTEAETIAFARQFDPQPFHIDPDAAKNSFFKGLVAETLARWFTEPYRQAGGKRLAEIGELVRNTPVNGCVGCCHAIPKVNLSTRLKEINCPILVIVGEDDMATPVAMAKEIHDNAPGSTLAVLPRAAYLANIEQAAGFNQAIEELVSAS